MFILIRDKRGVSIIIGYVLLVVVAIALAVIVFSWLRGQVDDGDEAECPEGVSLIVKNIECDIDGRELSFTLQNKGLFNLNGSIVRVNDRVDAEIGIYNISELEYVLSPGEEKEIGILFSNIKNDGGGLLESVSLVEIQAFVFDEGIKAYCENIVSEVLEDCVLT